MNIGILIPGFSDGEADWCIPVYLNLVRCLAQDHQNTVRVFALRYPPRRDNYSVYGAKVYAIGGHSSTAGFRRWLLLARTVNTIIRQHRDQPFDVLHAIWADETGFAAWIAGRLLNIPVVVSIAGGELVALPGYGLQAGRVSRWLVGQALRRADCVTGPCRYAADLAQNIRQAEIVPLGVDTTMFTPKIPITERRILAVGSLTNIKGQDRLLKAVCTLPDVFLEIAGEGPLLSELQRMAQTMGIAGRVKFHGAVAHDALPKLYQSAALHVLTSHHEAFGMVVIEAAACGIPTVGFPFGVLNDFHDAAAGITVPNGDIEALSDSIHALLDDSERRSAMGKRAREFVERNYTLSSMTDAMSRVYSLSLTNRPYNSRKTQQ